MKRDSELRDLDADSQWDFSALKGTRLPLPTDFLQTSTRPEDDAFVFFYANPGESGHIPKLLAVGVTDAQFIRDSKSGSFTVYKIVVQTRETKWSLIKRYSELRDFHKKVTKIECDSHFPYFPDKQIRNRFDQFVVERRKREITTYLRKLFRIAEDVPQVQNVVNEFFEVLSLQRFALSGDLKMIRYLTEELGCDLLSRDPNSGTALHYAAAQGNWPVLSYLISRLPKDIGVAQIFDKSGLSPFHVAPQPIPLELKSIIRDKDLEGFEKLSKVTQIPVQYLKPCEQRRYFVFINPFGGRKKAPRVLRNTVIPLFELLGSKYSLFETAYAGQATEIAAQMELDKVDCLVAVGGDGLVFEIVNGLMSRLDCELAIQIPIAVIPCGSGNGLACSIGYSSAYDATLKLTRGISTRIDLIECFQNAGSKKAYSVLSQSWGSIADIDFQSEAHRWMGEFRFTYKAVQKILLKKKYSCKIAFEPLVHGHGEEEVDSPLDDVPSIDAQGRYIFPSNWKVLDLRDLNVFLGCNAPKIASSATPAPDARLDDGVITLIIANGLSRSELAKFFLRLESGKHINGRGVTCIKTRKYVVIPGIEDSCFDLDGERFNNMATTFRLLRRHATIIS